MGGRTKRKLPKEVRPQPSSEIEGTTNNFENDAMDLPLGPETTETPLAKKTCSLSDFEVLQKSMESMLNKIESLQKEFVNMRRETLSAPQELVEVTTDNTPITENSSTTSTTMTSNPVVGSRNNSTLSVTGIPPTELQRVILYNVQATNMEKPIFESSVHHPVTFVDSLRIYLRKMQPGTPEQELELIQDCLKGTDKDWARIYRTRWNNFEDFKIDFLNAYWGEGKQSILRRKIAQGVWNKSEHATMLGHFLHLTGQSQMLSYKIPEKQLVTDIMRHFPKNIQNLWMVTKSTSIIDTAEFLRLCDEQEEESYKREEVQGKKIYNRTEKQTRVGNQTEAAVNKQGIPESQDRNQTTVNQTWANGRQKHQRPYQNWVKQKVNPNTTKVNAIGIGEDQPKEDTVVLN